MKAIIFTEGEKKTQWAALDTETTGCFSFYNVVKYFYNSLICDDFKILWEDGRIESMKAHYEKYKGL